MKNETLFNHCHHSSFSYWLWTDPPLKQFQCSVSDGEQNMQKHQFDSSLHYYLYTLQHMKEKYKEGMLF